MLKVKNNGNLIIISGPSGAGKGTICKELIRRNENIIPSISFTSRSIANGEKEGVDYFYISKQEFENKIKEGFFLEYAIVHNNDYYGTPKDKVLEYLNKGYNVILEIDIEGALKVKEIMKDVLCIFILPPSMKELRNRLYKRNRESEDKILARFKKAYQEINEIKKYNYVVVNDEVINAVNKIEAILLAEKCRVDRIEELDLDTLEESVHEDLIKRDK
ncbi:MAG: guanylate kinase [Firmicutes bacterium]|nr:guanylate kinase [Bacillota bacterium]